MKKFFLLLSFAIFAGASFELERHGILRTPWDGMAITAVYLLFVNNLFK